MLKNLKLLQETIKIQTHLNVSISKIPSSQLKGIVINRALYFFTHHKLVIALLYTPQQSNLRKDTDL